MTPRDVDVVVQRLASLSRTAQALALVVEDLYVVAYDRVVTDDVKVRGAEPADPITGNPVARRLFFRLAVRARQGDDILLGLAAAIGNVLNAGAANPDLFGSFVSPADFARALRAQRRRIERGEYVPHRNLPQPPYPKKGDKR